MADLKYFNTTKKGEMFELKADLNSDKKEKKKDAVKKIIASMTVGKDVSSLFPDVINCMQTDNLELKKLVYLYLMSYAKTQPDLAILAVNTFVKDCEDPNPLIRALAVRTMGCIRVDKISEYLCDPLRQCLKDEDPYVRKTAAVCVAKLYDINPQLVEDQGFLSTLKGMISDSNPMVVSNAVAALTEISGSSPNKVFELDSAITKKLLTALNECSEWGQVSLLDAIATYIPKDEREAQSICERVTSRLAHANSAVVLSTVKVLMLLVEKMDQNSEFVLNLEKKLSPPLVTLLSAEPEIQFVALRNINIIIQKRPSILSNELRVFFVKYNDPIYVKLEKLNIMIQVDVEFVCKAVRAIGRCAIKVEEAAERCVSTLLDLIRTRVNYVVQESVVVIKDIFRKYPNRYEGIIATLCENLDSLDEPEARASMIWIIGQYAERIENATEILGNFLDTFLEESNPQVQLQLLTAIVKTFLKKPKESEHLITRVLKLAAEESDNPDLRDRGYIYWRLLSTDSKAAREIVLSEKPTIGEETDNIEPALLDELVHYIGTLVSVFQRPPRSFLDSTNISAIKSISFKTETSPNDEFSIVNRNVVIANSESEINTPNLLDIDSFDEIGSTSIESSPQNVDLMIDADLQSILGFTSPVPYPSPLPEQTQAEKQESSGLDDIMELLSIVQSPQPQVTYENIEKKLWLSDQQGKGLEIKGCLSYDTLGNIRMLMTFSNKLAKDSASSPSVMTNFAMQLNRNPFRLCLADPLSLESLSPNESVDIEQKLARTGNLNIHPCPLLKLQVAVKNCNGISYFTIDLPIEALLSSEPTYHTNTEYINALSKLTEHFQRDSVMQCKAHASTDNLIDHLRKRNIFNVYKSHTEHEEILYQSLRLTSADEDMNAFIQIRRSLQAQNIRNSLKVYVRTSNAELPDVIIKLYEDVISQL
ncbi:hypothetical protein GJ496_011032 [Pomphorhynchus laevis]|nr:hypothetical protein GJ496_011032 [Pomphorhynchus laevis]